jgi:ubiquinone/menaquinone biosynthesis C-methylase UbiE
MAADWDERKHQGAENSPLKNSAPSSLTTLSTSESTSIKKSLAAIWVFEPRILDARSSIQGRPGRILETDRPMIQNKQVQGEPIMNAIANEILTAADLEQLKVRLKSTWMTGNYDLFSRYMEKDADQFYRRLGIKPGSRLLDVACGAGQLALIAARAGAKVTGCDIATNWIESAQTRAAAEGLKITFEEGDAESLPYEDAQFDAVVSLFGAMFAPRPELVAAELARVCRPGGMIAMANWTPGGFIGQMFKIIARHIAPSGMPSPVLWGDEITVRNRFNQGISGLRCSLHMYHFDYPFPPDAVVEFFRDNYGPMTRAFAALDAQGQEQLRNELVSLWSAHNQAVDNSTKVEAEYLEVIAIRA